MGHVQEVVINVLNSCSYAKTWCSSSLLTFLSFDRQQGRVYGTIPLRRNEVCYAFSSIT